jgi:hypothetical protein
MSGSRRDYENDVYYEVWRSGKNPDVINYDRVEDHYYNGDPTEAAARDEIRRQNAKLEERDQDERRVMRARIREMEAMEQKLTEGEK